MRACSLCASSPTVKNGHSHNGKQRFNCQDVRRQFVAQPTKKVSAPATRALIDRLLLERLSRAGSARAPKGSAQWLQTYVNEQSAKVPHQVPVTPQKKGRLTLPGDELWSCVDNKGNQQWVWLALDADTRERVGGSLGARDAAAAHSPKSGPRCLVSITKVPSPLRTAGSPMGQSYRASNSEPSVKKLLKPATLSAATTP